MQNTTNYNLQKPEPTIDNVDVTIINANMDKIDSQMKQNADNLTSHSADETTHIPYAVATGSANTYAVTLNPAPTAYVDGMAVCVKINVASTGVSTLNVNGLGAKTILDSLGNAITSGGLKANTPYTLRYESTSNSFIVQGKGGGGTVTANDLRSGVTATSDTGQVTGTVQTKGNNPSAGYEIQIGVSTSGGNVFLKAPKGIYDQDTWIKYSTDANCIPSNIVNSSSILGVAGNVTGMNTKAGDTVIAADGRYSNSSNASLNNGGTVPTQYLAGYKFTMNYAGSIRFKFYLARISGSGNAYGQVYKNGVAVGTLRTSTSGYVQYSEDFTCNAGDYFQLFTWNSDGSTCVGAYGMGIYALQSAITTLQVTTS